MILYNMRYRGPYEYEKSILNVFQFHNAISDMAKQIEESEDKNLVVYDKSLSELIEKVDNMNLQLSMLFEETYKQ